MQQPRRNRPAIERRPREHPRLRRRQRPRLLGQKPTPRRHPRPRQPTLYVVVAAEPSPSTRRRISQVPPAIRVASPPVRERRRPSRHDAGPTPPPGLFLRCERLCNEYYRQPHKYSCRRCYQRQRQQTRQRQQPPPLPPTPTHQTTIRSHHAPSGLLLHLQIIRGARAGQAVLRSVETPLGRFRGVRLSEVRLERIDHRGGVGEGRLWDRFGDCGGEAFGGRS
mmetsp:Transcript_6691/g.13608  ORF Transcript_6691/g.13608 Transcript_6691/m.13608 type:complete len:223 (+) Transcript_6691:127-795(+)